jgi:hypothetical protein
VPKQSGLLYIRRYSQRQIGIKMTPEQKLTEEVRILTEIVRALSQRVQELETALKESK